MIHWWLDLSPLPQVAVLVLLYFGFAAVVHAVTFRFFRSFTGVVAPFFGAVALLFGLLVGFLANDVGQRNRQATNAVVTEANSLIALHALAVAAPGNQRGVRDALRVFARSVLADEWPRMAERGGSADTDNAYRALLQQIAAPALASAAGGAVQSGLLASAQRVGSARSSRLALTFDQTEELKWLTVLILGLLTQVAIAFVHLESRRPQIAALTIFSTAAVVALSLIAVQEYPFSGAMQVAPAPIEGALVVIGNE